LGLAFGVQDLGLGLLPVSVASYTGVRRSLIFDTSFGFQPKHENKGTEFGFRLKVTVRISLGQGFGFGFGLGLGIGLGLGLGVGLRGKVSGFRFRV
jgi:hypothetical protein